MASIKSRSCSSSSSSHTTNEKHDHTVNLNDPQGSDTNVNESIKIRHHNKIIKFLLGHGVPPLPSERQPHPKSFKKVYSYATWAWVSSTLKTGFDRILEIQDIFLISDRDRIDQRMKEFHYKMAQYNDPSQNYTEFYSIIYALRWYFLGSLITGALFIAGSIGMSLMSRTLIDLIDKIYTGETTSHGHTVGFAIGATIVQGAFQFFLLWQNYANRLCAEFTRTMLISAVYAKLVKLSPVGRQCYPASKVTSLVTTDTNRIFMAVRWSSMIILFLPAFGAMIGVLVYNIGVSALVGCGLVAIGIVFNIFISRQITNLRAKSLPYADKRIGIIRETIEQMRIIKFYGWENSFVDLLSEARSRETRFLKILGLIEGLVDATLTSIPQFGGILSFAVRIITHNGLEPAIAFSSLTLFQLLVPFSMMFSSGITSHADAFISVKRLNSFFKAPEEGNYIEQGEVNKQIVLKDGFFSWVTTSETTSVSDVSTSESTPASTCTLENINLTIAPGQLIMIFGSIGSGKTSLLSAILGLIPKTKGNVTIGGSVSAVLSTWSQNATIRENILFGKPYDPIKYQRTIFSCCLQTDLENIAGGDLVEVGERGITLSGGQKARIALARCVYADTDIVILDDVLSAVDGKVASHIMKYCINGVLKTRTRVMTTHNLKILSSADKVVYLPGDGSIVFGNVNELPQEFLRVYQSDAHVDAHEDADADADVHSGVHTVTHVDAQLTEPNEEAEVFPFMQDDPDLTVTVDLDTDTSVEDPSGGPLAVTKIVQEEQRATGRVSNKILMNYINSGSKLGLGFVLVILLVQACVSTAQVMQSIVLQFWTSNQFNRSQGFYIGMYCLVVALRAIFFVLMVVCVCYFCYSSASELHDGAIKRIYRAPMSYFDTTPLGRIVNRFTDDTANLDTQMLMLLRMVLFSVSTLLASIIAVFVYVPYTILTIVPILIIAFVLMNYYRASARELKRINSVFRSSMFSVVTETIGGLETILGYSQQQRFSTVLHTKIDDMNVSFEINLASQLWLSLRIATATLMVTLIVFMLATFQVFNINASKIGVLVSLLPSISISIVTILPLITDLENQMNSVERLYELKYDIPQEAPYQVLENPVPENWPSRGATSFQNVVVKYRPELPPVLKSVSFDIKGGEKIGICGRTGAGKSTILSVLFRLCELDSGRIEIDNVDISHIGLSDLRNHLAIIPQEPVLFEGTVQTNLDPFGQHTIAALESALRRSKLDKDMKFSLNAKVDAGGSNFSLGERQLLTLARALVRNAKILVLDEATAAVDVETDNHIQETIRLEFADCTVLCIAHRLQTIVNYDRVLIMNSGEVQEMGDPHELFVNKSTLFAKMCDESQITERDFHP